MALKLNDNLAGATSGRIQTFVVKTEKIEFNKKFQIFPIDEKLVEEISESIKKNGFYKEEPVALWIDPEGHKWVVDGNTRAAAALKAGIPEVVCVYKKFASEQEAIQYAFERQAKRRNLTDYDLLSIAEKIGMSEEFKNYGSKKEQIKFLMETVNVGKEKAHELLFVTRNATEEQKEAIRNGEVSNKSVYNRIKKSNKKNYSDNPFSSIFEIDDEADYEVEVDEEGDSIESVVDWLELEGFEEAAESVRKRFLDY